MSDALVGPGWWLASDGNWYPPESAADASSPTQSQDSLAITCAACGAVVSRNAKACPACGEPTPRIYIARTNRRTSTKAVAVIVAVTAVLLIGVFGVHTVLQRRAAAMTKRELCYDRTLTDAQLAQVASGNAPGATSAQMTAAGC